MATVKRKPLPSDASIYAPLNQSQDIPAALDQNFATPFVDEPLFRNGPKGGAPPSPSPPSQQFVRWGIAWQAPTSMVCLALSGVLLALGHHFYYLFLDGTVAGSASRQQWAIRFGTAFSFLVVACLKVASGQAYEQYIWTIVRRKSFSLGALDKFFRLLSNPFRFLSLELLLHTRFAVFLAAICWCIALSGLTPPATLSVVPGLYQITEPTPFLTLNSTSKNFYLVEYEDSVKSTEGDALPTPDVVRIASQTGYGMEIMPLAPPAPNSSFALQFYGPSVQCSPANDTQNPVFDYFSNSLWAANGVATEQTFTGGNLSLDHQSFSQPADETPRMLYFSAFAPFSGPRGWLFRLDQMTTGPDLFNNWDVDLPHFGRSTH